MNPLIQRETTILPALIGLVFAGSVLLPTSKAFGVNPPPDGGYGPPLYGPFNTAEGDLALLSLEDGQGNTAVGVFSLSSVITSNFNTAVGAGALDLNTADNNTAVGAATLLLNTTGTNNTASGVDALAFNDAGSGNTANGAFALFMNTEGNNNTAVGSMALFSNIDTSQNTAIGVSALQSNTGSGNTANGWSALGSNTTGGFNTAVGWDALGSNTTGGGNTALGYGALFTNTEGSNNTVLGAFAGKGVTTAHDVICIGNGVLGGDVNNSTWIASVYGVTTQNTTTAPVIVSADGQLGTVVSSERFKKDITNMQKTSEAILALRPVTFHYKTDTKETPQFGLIAEEVAKVNPALVLPDREGKPYTVRYDAVNAMLLNEFLKEHRMVQEQGAMIARQQKQIEALTTAVQKVSAQLELNKPVPRTVLNDQ
jgi:hypothetical protein